jgi:hypothetical protein
LAGGKSVGEWYKGSSPLASGCISENQAGTLRASKDYIEGPQVHTGVWKKKVGSPSATGAHMFFFCIFDSISGMAGANWKKPYFF